MRVFISTSIVICVLIGTVQNTLTLHIIGAALLVISLGGFGQDPPCAPLHRGLTGVGPGRQQARRSESPRVCVGLGSLALPCKSLCADQFPLTALSGVTLRVEEFSRRGVWTFGSPARNHAVGASRVARSALQLVQWRTVRSTLFAARLASSVETRATR